MSYDHRAANSLAPTIAASQQARKKPRVAPRRARQQQQQTGSGELGRDNGNFGVRSPYRVHSLLQQEQQAHHYRSTTAIDESVPIQQQQQQQRQLSAGSSLVNMTSTLERPQATSSANLITQPAEHCQSASFLGYQHLGQQLFSASQAQLQSLTNLAFAAAGANNPAAALRLTTPKSQRGQPLSQLQPPHHHHHHHHNHHEYHQLQQHQQQQQRGGQTALAATKPMTSMLNEPSLAAMASTMGRQPQRCPQDNSAPGVAATPALQAASAASVSAVAVAAAQLVAAANQPLPPPYSADAPQQQQPNNSHQQHVICHQPVAAAAAVQASSQFACSDQNGGQQQSQTQQQQVATSRAGAQVPNCTSSSVAHFQANGQQQLFNFLGGGQTSGQQQQQHLPYLHSLQQQQLAQTTSGEQSGSLPSFSAPSASSKSASCLTCADISIKWYIVVIALLGLICALIGTIVGAVHSAGRDYISLALLLLGVGLVLVAISWIALRITIKTYKTNAARSSLGSRQTQSPLRAAHLARLFGQTSQCNSSSAATMRRSLLNERLYLMAAAAAAAAAVSRQVQPPPQSSSSLLATQQQPDELGPQQQQQPQTVSFAGLMGNLKQRLGRLIPYSSLRESASTSAGPDSATYPGQYSSRRQQQASEQIASFGGANQAALAAAAAILQQYQQTGLLGPQQATHQHQLHAHYQPHLAHPAFLFPPPQPPAHLLGHLLGSRQEFPFRPPPPSYSASMQDHRFRMLLQERAVLHQLSSTATAATAASSQARPPPPPSLAHSQAATSNGGESEAEAELATAGDEQTAGEASGNISLSLLASASAAPATAIDVNRDNISASNGNSGQRFDGSARHSQTNQPPPSASDCPHLATKEKLVARKETPTQPRPFQSAAGRVITGAAIDNNSNDDEQDNQEDIQAAFVGQQRQCGATGARKSRCSSKASSSVPAFGALVAANLRQPVEGIEGRLAAEQQ